MVFFQIILPCIQKNTIFNFYKKKRCFTCIFSFLGVASKNKSGCYLDTLKTYSNFFFNQKIIITTFTFFQLKFLEVFKFLEEKCIHRPEILPYPMENLFCFQKINEHSSQRKKDGQHWIKFFPENLPKIPMNFQGGSFILKLKKNDPNKFTWKS